MSDIEQIKVSVIIPFYNVEKYIEECLTSVTGQTLREIEIICVDDASPDGSAEIVCQFAEKDSRIKLLRNAENSGVAVARNHGLEQARGEYIYIIDSDDFLRLDAVEKMYDCAVENDADLVLSDACKYYEDGREELCCNPYKDKHIRNWGGGPAWLYIFKRSLAEKHPDIRFPVGAHPDEDVIFSFMLFSYVKKSAAVDEPLLFYRQHANMCTNRVRLDKQEECFRSLVICLDSLRKFMRNHRSVAIVRDDAYISLILTLIDQAHEKMQRRLKDFPLRIQYIIRMYIIRRFFFRCKITSSGRLMIKVCKIPLLSIRV